MKNKFFLYASIFLLFVASLSAQQNNVGINTTTPHSSAALQVDSKNNNQGILIPQLTATQRQGIIGPASGLLVYETTSKSYWYYDGSSWVDFETIKNKIENGDASVEVLNTASADSIKFKVNNGFKWRMVSDRIEPTNTNRNLFIGQKAGGNNTLNGSMGEGNFNTFIGSSTGFLNSSGARNTFIGALTGFNNISGKHNVFIGESAGTGNTTGGINICIGNNSGSNLASGNHNVFIGGSSGHDNTKIDNVFIGSECGFGNNGSKNIFIGRSAGSNEMGSERLYIENSSSADPLIYGEFDNDLIRINGNLNINNAFSFPTVDGTANQVLATNGSGTISWTSVIPDPASIEDSDSNTKIDTDVGGDDAIHFYTPESGTITERWRMKEDRLEEVNMTSNIFIGKNAGTNNSIGTNNTFLGSLAGEANTEGTANVYIGQQAGAANNIGTENTIIGFAAGALSTSGAHNVFIGHQTGNSTSGTNNTFVGFQTGGGGASDGNGNVFLGNKAGFNEMGSNLLYIENTEAPIPLIWGDFANDLVGINRIATTNAFEVEGEASKTTAGSWVGNSDARLKKNIEQLDSEMILQKLLTLKGVTYEWNDDKTGAQRPEGKQYGFIAQNIQEVFPELVEEDKLGYLQTAYGTYDAMQIEAIRALVNRMEKLEKENQALKAQWEELAFLKAEVEAMKVLKDQ